MYKTLGIIGGMGPAATCDLMEKIIRQTDAPDDQHHIRLLVDVNTGIPDRTAALLRGGPDPVPEMLKSVLLLQKMGAEGLMMPCNTAHCFYERLAPELSVPLLHMPEETARYAAGLGVRTVGLLATDGTVQSGIYAEAFRRAGIETVCPGPAQQALVMKLIYERVKAGKSCRDIPVRDVADELRKQGAQKLILACTELPIAFAELGLLDGGVIDPSAVLARAAVLFAGAPLKEN